MSFIDRQVQYPGRVRATDVNTSDDYVFDIVREEGTITEEGTTLDSDGFDEALESYIEIGQTNSDFISDTWGDATGVTLSASVSGNVKYAIAGESVTVLVKLTATAALSGETQIASISGTGTAPANDIIVQTRADQNVTVKYTTAGKLIVNGDFGIGTQFYCAFEF